MDIRATIVLCAFTLLSYGCRSGPPVAVSQESAAEARQQLLAPARHGIHLSGVDVPTAVREIHRLFGWTPNPEMDLEGDTVYVKDVRVTIDRDAASLAEVLADLCNQTGFDAFEDFDNMGIYGAIGDKQIGGRGLAFAMDGVLLLLSVQQFQCDKPATFTIFPHVVDAVPWLYHDDARLQIDELVYPDGSRTNNLKETAFLGDIPFAPLVANRGQIKTIRGVLSIQVPCHVAVEQIRLDPRNIPSEEHRDHHFVRVTKLNKAPDGWLLACEYGHWSLNGQNARFDYGHVDVLDAAGMVMDGRVGSVGSGSLSSGGWTTSTNEHSKTFEIVCPTRPSALQWTYVGGSEQYRIPVHFENCRVPDAVWNQKQMKEQAQPEPDGDGLKPAP